MFKWILFQAVRSLVWRVALLLSMLLDMAMSRCVKRKFSTEHSSEQPENSLSRCSVFSDWEEPDLTIWNGAGTRRDGEFQHMRDAPVHLVNLLRWLLNLSEFEEVTGLCSPDYSSMRDLASPEWTGIWTPRALLVFQAAANASGVIYPPQSLRSAWGRSKGESLQHCPHSVAYIDLSDSDFNSATTLDGYT